jgi:hypothetical protein
MGLDLSLVFVPTRIPADDLRRAVMNSFGDSLPANLVVLYSDGSSCSAAIRQAFKVFTVVSLWGDCGTGATRFALEISRRIPAKAVVLTAADHSCVGGYQIIEAGQLLESFWSDPTDVESDYTACGAMGVTSAYGTELPGNYEVRFLLDDLMASPKGFCIQTSTEMLHPGQPLRPDQVLRVMENDFPDAVFECLLAD